MAHVATVLAVADAVLDVGETIADAVIEADEAAEAEAAKEEAAAQALNTPNQTPESPKPEPTPEQPKKKKSRIEKIFKCIKTLFKWCGCCKKKKTLLDSKKAQPADIKALSPMAEPPKN